MLSVHLTWLGPKINPGYHESLIMHSQDLQDFGRFSILPEWQQCLAVGMGLDVPVVPKYVEYANVLLQSDGFCWINTSENTKGS